MEPDLMTLHCDYCRGELRFGAQRYWRMRFCSNACKKAYQQRLDESTREKIGRLDRATCHTSRTIGHFIGFRRSASFHRHRAA
jgi:hypothetical protein